MDTASDKALQRFAELMIEKIKQVEDLCVVPFAEEIEATQGGLVE